MNRDYYLMRYPSLVKQADEGQAIEEHLGPLQHAYVADAVGADAMQRGLEQASQQDEGGLIDTVMASEAARVAPLQRRIRHGASGFAESPKTRIMGAVDPTMLLTQDPNASLTNLIMGTGKKDPDQEDLVAERYKHHIRQYQDKDNPEAVETTRETPYHKILQSIMAERDTEVAGNKYLRKSSPGHYWTNPFAKSGPLSELYNRMTRRDAAASAWPDSTAGRFGMNLGNAGTLGILGQIMGDEEAQESLRRSAVKNKIYPDAAMPDKKAAALLLKCAGFLVKQAAPDWLGSAAKGVGKALGAPGKWYGEAANASTNRDLAQSAPSQQMTSDQARKQAIGAGGSGQGNKSVMSTEQFNPDPKTRSGQLAGIQDQRNVQRGMQSRDSDVSSAAYARAQSNPRYNHLLEGYNSATASYQLPERDATQQVAKPISNPGWEGGNSPYAPGTKIDDNYTVPSQVDNAESARIDKYRSQLPARGATQQPVAQQPAPTQIGDSAAAAARAAGGSPVGAATPYINTRRSSRISQPVEDSPLKVAPPDEQVHFETAEVIPNPTNPYSNVDTTVNSQITPDKRLTRQESLPPSATRNAIAQLNKSGAAAAVNLLKCARFLVKQAH